jgi:ATP-binding cassette subfamily B protein
LGHFFSSTSIGFSETSITNDNSIDEIALSGQIKFDKVSFTYPETGIKALDNVSFEIGTGKTLAITGRTGSGKSSIANLLFRMYDVDQGSISIDDVDVKKLPLYHYRNQMALVPQEVFLFSDTIRNNIAFGIDQFTEEQIVQAAQNAVVYDNILQFDKGFDTLVGERGITLSGGQKQRISIARAILKEPKILVFDDALSAVDTKTEEAILKRLKLIMKNRTSIIISHRVSTVKHADLIVYMENGKIIEKGTHDELVALKKSYAELYQKQLLEEESVEM